MNLNGAKPRLYVVKNELASHDPLRHVAVQLLEFLAVLQCRTAHNQAILLSALQTSPPAKDLCQQYARLRNYRNLDHMLEEMVFDRLSPPL